MANDDEHKAAGRRGFFRDGFDTLVRSVMEAREVVNEVAEDVREVARGAMGDEPVESGGRTFYRDRRKRVLAKDHEAIVAIRESLSRVDVASDCRRALDSHRGAVEAFEAYAEKVASYRGKIEEYESILEVRTTFVNATLRGLQRSTLSEAEAVALPVQELAESTSDPTFRDIARGLRAIGYFRQAHAAELAELAETDVPMHARARLELLAACVGGRAAALLGLDDEDSLKIVQDDLQAEGRLPGFLVADLSNELSSRLMHEGLKANQAHREAEHVVSSAVQIFVVAQPLDDATIRGAASVTATRYSPITPL